MGDEIIKVEISIKKKDLFKFADKFGIKEFHFSENKVSLDMTRLFDEAMTQVTEKANDLGLL